MTLPPHDDRSDPPRRRRPRPRRTRQRHDLPPFWRSRTFWSAVGAVAAIAGAVAAYLR